MKRKMFRLLILSLTLLLSTISTTIALEKAEGYDFVNNSAVSTACEGMAPGNLGLAITPDGSKAYIPFALDDAVLVVDLQTFSVAGCVDVSPVGHLLRSQVARITPDGRYVFVTNDGTENIMVIDTASNTVHKVLPIRAAWGDRLKISHDGKKIYVATPDRYLRIIDTSDFSFVKVGGIFIDAAIPSKYDPNLLYCLSADEGKHFFFTYDLSSNTVLRKATLPDGTLSNRAGIASRFIIDPLERVAYFGQQEQYDGRGHGNLVAFDIENFKMLSSTPIENGVTDFTLNTSNGKIYVIGFWSGGSSPGTLNITEYDTTSHTITRLIPVLPMTDPWAIAVDPLDPNYLYFTETDENTFSKIEISTGDVVQKLDLAPRGEFSPNSFISAGELAYIVCPDFPTVFEFDLSIGLLTGSISLPGGMSGNHNGGYYQGHLYFVNGRTIYKVKPSGGSVVDTYDIGFDIFPSDLTFFDDKMVTIDFYPGGHIAKKLILFEAQTMTIRKVVDLPEELHAGIVNASPDGSKLYTVRGYASGPTTVTVFNSSTLDVENTIVISSHGSDSSGAGYFDETKRLFYLLGFQTVFVINMDTDELVEVLDTHDLFILLDRPKAAATALNGIAPSPEKDMLFVISSDIHSMLTYNIAESRWMPEILNLGISTSGHMVSSPDLRFLYMLNGFKSSITVVDTSTRQVVKVIPLVDRSIDLDVDPAQGTTGTELRITGWNLGVKEGKVTVGTSKCKVLEWTDTLIRCLLTKVSSAMRTGTHDLTVKHKGKAAQPIVVKDAFSIMAPDIQAVTTGGNSATITGLFFGTKKVKAYLVVDGNGKRKKLKVTSLQMDSRTGVSQLEMTVSNKVLKKLKPGSYDVIVTNQFGEDTFPNGFTLE